MFEKARAVASLVRLTFRDAHPEPPRAAEMIQSLRTELKFWRDSAKERGERLQPLIRDITNLQVQNSYLRSTNNLMRETMEEMSIMMLKKQPVTDSPKVFPENTE